MRFNLEVDEADVQRLQVAYMGLASHEFVQQRAASNTGPTPQRPSRGDLWESLVMALASSQQRSARGSRLWALWQAKSCPLGLEVVQAWSPDIAKRVGGFLKDWGGIRFYRRIGEFLDHNYRAAFTPGGDERFEAIIDMLWALRQLPASWDDSARLAERGACTDIIGLKLKGIGTKQCRNWLQDARLLRYEIPLDSRVLKFLRPMFPNDFPLEQQLLGWPSYYHFIEDAVQDLGRRAGILPCVADAVMFLVADGRA